MRRSTSWRASTCSSTFPTDAHPSEVRRALKSGGWYLIQTPNRYTNVVFETIRWRSFTCFRQDHCSLFDEPLAARLRRHGFEPQVYDVPVVNAFFRAACGLRRLAGDVALALVNLIGFRFQADQPVCRRATRKSRDSQLHFPCLDRDLPRWCWR
jgi:hypothetical protein